MKSEYGQFIGKWVHVAPWDSEDFMVEYEISGTDGKPVIKAKDINDGEKLKISNAKWDGKVLEFVSLMPSTGRKGFNRFKLDSKGQMKSEFTFKVIETLKRIEG